MDLRHTSILLTGGSRGLGLGLAEALTERGAKLTVVARLSEALTAVKDRLEAAIEPADVTDPDAAKRIVKAHNPDILILNAGTPPPMASIDDMRWEDFTATWETDVKADLYWIQAALKAPLKPGSRVLLTSSGAAIHGSPMSGGYGGAKRMIGFLAQYAQALSDTKSLGIRFQTILPRQMVAGTGTGDAGSQAYAKAHNITPEAFLTRFGRPLTPRHFGDMVVAILEEPRYAEGAAFSLKAETGITPMEGFAD